MRHSKGVTTSQIIIITVCIFTGIASVIAMLKQPILDGIRIELRTSTKTYSCPLVEATVHFPDCTLTSKQLICKDTYCYYE